MVEIFEFDGDDITINKPEVLLIKEFNNLWYDAIWGECSEDPDGMEHIKARKFFKYLWLAHNYRSDYMELTEAERHTTALQDAGLSEGDISYGPAQLAIFKYNQLQDTRVLKLLRTAHNTVDKIRGFLDNINLDERDDKGRLVNNVGDVMRQVADLGKVSSGLDDLEYQVKKNMEKAKAVRGDDTELGAFD